MSNDTELFFVYGTLKKGGHFASQFDDYRVKSLEATIENCALFNLGWFPCIQYSEGSVVHGELHEYKHPDIVRATMDRIEGYSGNPEIDLYTRKRAVVCTAEGEFEAFVYEFAAKLPPHAKKVECGVWELSGTKD